MSIASLLPDMGGLKYALGNAAHTALGYRLGRLLEWFCNLFVLWGLGVYLGVAV